MPSDDRHHLAAEVERTLRGWLRTGRLRPGVLYSVQQVAQELDVSRSPAREAVLALAEAGLVTVTRNRGFQVVVPTGRRVAEIFAVRMALEPRAAQQAARRASADDVRELADLVRDLLAEQDPARFSETDQRLHDVVLRVAGNELARESIARLREVTRVVGPSTAGRTRGLLDIALEHQPVVEAIGAGDSSRARLTMRHHLANTGRLLIRQCAEGGDTDAWAAWEELVEADL